MDFRLSVVKSAWQDFQQKQTLWELTTPEGKDRQLRRTGGVAIVGEAEGILADREIRVHIVESVPNIEREDEEPDASKLREQVAMNQQDRAYYQRIIELEGEFDVSAGPEIFPIIEVLSGPGRRERKMERLMELLLNDQGDDVLALDVYDKLGMKGVPLPCQAVR